MSAIAGQPIVTATEMRAAEDRAIAGGRSIDALMAEAGAGIAAAVARLAGDRRVLILCGPGNNGGDGYVAARRLAQAGVAVRIAASGPPRTDAAVRARDAWRGPVEDVAAAAPAPVLIDCLFGTGLARPLEPVLAGTLARLVAAAESAVAVDLPSGVATDDGALLGPVPVFDHTFALGALKASHMLQPAAACCGALEVVDLGLELPGETRVLMRPMLGAPPADAHKYARGMVAVVSGAMPGAGLLASIAALRSGAGYVAVLGGNGGGPLALVHRPFDAASLADARIGALVIGPGLGRDEIANARLAMALATDHTLLVDGDALHLASIDQLAARAAPTVLTPHAGEFAALFGPGAGSKIDRARAAARRSQAVVVFKGADTVIADPGGRVVVAEQANSWLSTAGTGDVLAGAIAAMLASGLPAFAAAAAGVWLHAAAARRCPGAFIADDLAFALSAVRGGG
ncbi:bifunctional ADP-dependent NAD(P)H-hydrate dehydratase/NAD(P)H-hydrate epimerase [Sphingomonas sp. 28-63-12]|uniref:NAD(P)H-hydrate dehydratase n=1 Tax=Sphingomonas sp. 28-63-12 TaxID=1970434 RepID=UPI000BCFECA5|nr:MAG: bifunctional ADP-dependent NAD(P)H-hydrate dehydratase/NAD(P)H-hydrate epimerase [Sphingomonas sp. 28-63-12]